MKRTILSLLSLLLFTLGAHAQDSFRKGTNALSLGVGVGQQTNVSIPALSLTYDYSIADNLFEYGSIGLGGQVEYQGYSFGNLKATDVFAGVRLTGRYEFVDRLDTYLGLQAGLFSHTGDLGANSFRFAFNGVAGARYLFNDTFALFGEFSTGISIFKVGLSFNL